MSLSFRSLTKAAQLQAALRPVCTTTLRGFASGSDPLKDPRTKSAQQQAHETDEATKDSVSFSFSPGTPAMAWLPGVPEATDLAKTWQGGSKPAQGPASSGRLGWAGLLQLLLQLLWSHLPILQSPPLHSTTTSRIVLTPALPLTLLWVSTLVIAGHLTRPTALHPLQIRHAAEGKPGEAAKDIGEMAKNAARQVQLWRCWAGPWHSWSLEHCALLQCIFWGTK